jgi:hypothetical protein
VRSHIHLPEQYGEQGIQKMRFPRHEFPDVSKATTGTLKHGDQDVRVWNVHWYPVASDGTDWHNALEAAQLMGGFVSESVGLLATRVADLSLHQYDISFCERILKEYGSKFVNEYSDLLLALWIAVLTKFFSCFRTGTRSNLKEDEVYSSNPKELDDFNLLLALRNKHIVHNVNSLYGAEAFAWREQNGDVRYVAAMVFAARIDPTLVAAMRTLVERAQEYLHIAIGDAGEALLAEVKAMTPEARAALPKSVYLLRPTEGDIKKARR